jgi:methionine-rich copper-binding protein CopC
VPNAFRALLVSLLAVAGAAAAIVAGPLPSASAHAELVATVPKQGATVPARPATVTLTFSDPIDQKFARTAVTGPGGAPQQVQATAVGPTVAVPVPDHGPGAYKVVYRVVSADGHPVSGELDFTVAGVPTAGPSASPTGPAPSSPAPSSPAASSSAPASAAAPSAAPAETGGSSSALLVGMIALAVVAGAGALWLAFGRSRRG